MDDQRPADAPDKAEFQDAPHWGREHFIPLRKADVVRLLAEDEQLAPADRERFLRLCQLIDATLHMQYHQRLQQLKDLYTVFNPDAVTRRLRTVAPAERAALAPQLFAELDELLRRANYRQLTRSEIEKCVGAASDWGLRLHINFEIFARLEVYTRGDVIARRKRRRWQKLYRVEEVDVPIYQRLVVIFRLEPHSSLDERQDTQSVYIKLFKNVPKQDIDMLLPGARFRMNLVDIGKTALPTLSGVTLATLKIVKGALLLPFAGLAGLVAFLVFVFGTIGYGVKSFFSFLRTKDKYQLNLTRSLYYQNLDNNAGVLFRLLDEAEEQDTREAIVAYALLRRKAGEGGWSGEVLDAEAERFLEGVLGFEVDFEVADALAKLEQLGCARRGPDGRWRAVPPYEALVGLDRAWDSTFDYAELARRTPDPTP